MWLIIIWYFFHNYFWPRLWPHSPGLCLGLVALASSSRFWPRFNITDFFTERTWYSQLADARLSLHISIREQFLVRLAVDWSLNWRIQFLRIHQRLATIDRQWTVQHINDYERNTTITSWNSDPARTRLHSASSSDYTGPRTRTRLGDRAFSVAGPGVWNSLPVAVREADSLHSFRRKLKTHLLTLCFNDWLSVFTNFCNVFPIWCRVGRA